MITTEKNIAIAEMLGWRKLTKEEQMKWFSCSEECLLTLAKEVIPLYAKEKDIIFSDDLRFLEDANWQFEAINYLLQNDISYNLVIFRKNVSVSIQKCYSDDEGVYIKREDGNFTEAIFEALYQFSQYLKQKN